MEMLHQIFELAMTHPVIALAALAATIAGGAIPWMVEANVPMQEWSGWRFRLITYLVAAAAGPVAGITFWHDWSALGLWVPALGINVVRDIASHWFPWLSPRAQAVKEGADGSLGYHVPGIDKTVWTRPPTAPPDQGDKK